MIVYLLKSGTIALICLMIYHLILKREKMFVFNRFFLLLGLLAALVIPTMDFSFSYGMSTVNAELSQLELIFTGAQNIDSQVSQVIDWGFVVKMIYGLITALLIVRFSIQIFILIRKVHRSKKSEINGVVLVQSEKEKVPFAFWNYIFVPKETEGEETISSEVLTHESAHVRQFHSVDILFVELFRLVFWFNPVFFYLKKAIQLNHEFLADNAVVEDYKNISEYQDILLNSLTPSHNEFLTSSFNYNVTKHRLKMMYKHTTNRKRTVLAASCAPLFLAVALFFSGHSIAQDSKISKSERKVNESYFKDATFTFKNKKGQDIYSDYEHLSEDRKSSLPPPPPIPSGARLEPLQPATVVVLTDDGKVIIKSKNEMRVPPPPPPPPAPERSLRKKG